MKSIKITYPKMPVSIDQNVWYIADTNTLTNIPNPRQVALENLTELTREVTIMGGTFKLLGLPTGKTERGTLSKTTYAILDWGVHMTLPDGTEFDGQGRTWEDAVNRAHEAYVFWLQKEER